MKELLQIRSPPTSTTVSTHLDERLHLRRRRSGMKGRKRVLFIVVSVLLGSWLTFDVGKKVPTTAAIASAVGGRSRSVDDATSGSPGPGGRNVPRIRKSSRCKLSRSNPGTSETVFHEAPIAPLQSCRVRNTELQERKKYDQAAYFAKADKSYPWLTEPSSKELKCVVVRYPAATRARRTTSGRSSCRCE